MQEESLIIREVTESVIEKKNCLCGHVSNTEWLPRYGRFNLLITEALWKEIRKVKLFIIYLILILI